MFDFYALPNDFPEYSVATNIQDQYQMVDSVEFAD